jgi:uncharacterized protein (TIGR04255 family)
VKPIGSIPDAPRFRLENDQLAQVICQIRFSPVLRIRQDESVIAFQEQIRRIYPRYSKQQGVHVLLTPAGVQQPPVQDSQHRFSDAEGAFSVILTPEFIALETTSFSDIDDFAQRIAYLAAAVQENYEPAEIHRLGLRFINELRFTTSDPVLKMLDAIEPGLLGAAGAPELLGVIKGSQQVLELEGEDRRMLVRHGYQPSGTTVDPAIGPERADLSRLQHPFYLLDVDVFAERNVPFNQEHIETRVREFNDDIRSFFVWGVKEEYRREHLRQREV